MNHSDSWLVLDTETSGLNTPIYVVEIAAQKMRGWERDGDPFRVFLNHDVPIEPQAEAIHGYSREYLRKNGIPPLEAHAQFRSYAGEAPLVAFNISYDWDRALVPEYQRLGCPTSGKKGFCAMTLSRRTIAGVSNYKLETLKDQFGLNSSRSHQGRNDVETLCALLEKIIAPKLYNAGIIGFDSIAQFSRRTPVALCLEEVNGAGDAVWYCLDAQNQTQGPYTAATLRSWIRQSVCYVWREGMAQWATSSDLPEFAPVVAPKKTRAKKVKKPCDRPKVDGADELSRWTAELIGICKGVMADGVVSEDEFHAMQNWFMCCPCIHLFPLSVVAEKIEMILLDGVVTPSELDEFKRTLGTFLELTAQSIAERPSIAVLKDTDHYEVINLEQGTKQWLAWRHGGIGASDAPTILGENPWKDADTLLLEKRGAVRASKPNAAMALGTALEPQARRRFISQSGIVVQPACLQSLRYEWLRASVDGISADGKSVAELKCGESVYRRTAQGGCVPHYYYGQLQHILAITGLPSIHFFCHFPGQRDILLNVKRDDAYIERLLVAEYSFWQQVLA